MDTKRLQQRLGAAGFDPGPIDGLLGPGTYAALFSYMARRPLGDRGKLLGEGAAKYLHSYGMDQALRLAHFLGQATHETGDFCYLRELWGPTVAQRGYEGRADLGNTQPGDGKLFMGRGIFQLTGRANYRSFGKRIDIDLEAEPDLAARPDLSVLIACLYWQDHCLNDWADRDDVLAVSRAINCGSARSPRTPNHLAERIACVQRAKSILT